MCACSCLNIIILVCKANKPTAHVLFVLQAMLFAANSVFPNWIPSLNDVVRVRLMLVKLLAEYILWLSENLVPNFRHRLLLCW